MSFRLSKNQMIHLGYLPEVLPPVFTSRMFANFVEARKATGYISKNKRADWTKCTEYSATKRGSQRRTFAFPHPESFHDIAFFISEKWDEILAQCKRSNYSASIPQSTPSGDRAISITSQKDLAIIVYKIMSPYRYTVKTDIARFYPSVYTHTITWAMHGKEMAKNDVSKGKLTHDYLDKLVRSSQDDQSVGLPVGPDSSRVIAEIIASAVDTKFAKLFYGEGVAVVRHVDDVWIGANSMDQAENYLYAYRECLREFNLDINDLKTSIMLSSDAPEPPWPLSIKIMIKNEYKRLNSEDQTRLLSQIFKMAHEQRDDGIVKYAIRRFDREKLWTTHWSILEPFLIRCVTSFPHSIDYVARVVSWSKRKGKEMRVDDWRQVLFSSLERNSNLGNDSEVCWMLWLMKELEITVPTSIADAIIARCGAFPVVMLFSLRPRIIKQAKRRQKCVAGLLGNAPFRGNYWLLAYEAAVRGWLPETMLPRAQMSDFMAEMVNAKVSFFDVTARPAFLKSIDDLDRHAVLKDYAIEDMAGRYDDSDDDIEKPYDGTDELDDDLSVRTTADASWTRLDVPELDPEPGKSLSDLLD